jgi:hypothetical protein
LHSITCRDRHSTPPGMLKVGGMDAVKLVFACWACNQAGLMT